MPLYLDEIYFNISSKEEYKQVCERMTNNMNKGFPPGVTLKGDRGSRTRSARSC